MKHGILQRGGRLLLLAFLAGGPGEGILQADPVPVELLDIRGSLQLLRDGEPYFIKGAGGNGDLGLLAAIGGNSVRTWGDTTVEFLDRAHAAGLSVCVGLWIEHERHGFDYGDDAAVAAQIERHCRVVDRLKDHPAVLMWGIGNEVELQYTNPRVWDVIEAVAAHIRKVDPHHPTMTVIAQAPEREIHEIMERCPSIDILGCNSYGGIGILAGQILGAGWEKPYIVTEWGSDGNWEVDKTSWGAEIEASSTKKARQRALRYGLIAGDRENCLGGYAFNFGNKMETTPTWFGMFLPDGSRTESVDVLQYLWTGTPPEHPAPRIGSLLLNGLPAEDSVSVKAGESLVAEVQVLDGHPDSLQAEWRLLAENLRKGLGGDREPHPEELALDPQASGPRGIRFTAPEEPGAYRLFLYVRNKNGGAATANFPFRVE